LVGAKCRTKLARAKGRTKLPRAKGRHESALTKRRDEMALSRVDLRRRSSWVFLGQILSQVDPGRRLKRDGSELRRFKSKVESSLPMLKVELSQSRQKFESSQPGMKVYTRWF